MGVADPGAPAEIRELGVVQGGFVLAPQDEVQLVDDRVALGDTELGVLGGEGDPVPARGQPHPGVGVPPHRPLVAERQPQFARVLAVDAQEDVGGALFAHEVRQIVRVGEHQQLVRAVLRDLDIEGEHPVGTGAQAAHVVAAGSGEPVDGGRGALGPVLRVAAARVGRVLGFVRPPPTHRRRQGLGPVAAGRQDHLAGRHGVEAGQTDRHHALDDRQFLVPQPQRLFGGAHLARPGDLHEPDVDHGAEDLLVHVLEDEVGGAPGSAEQRPGLPLPTVEGGDALEGVLHVGVRGDDPDGVAGQLSVGVVQPPLAVGLVRLHRRVVEIAGDVPVGEVGVDLRLLDRGDPLDHLAGHRDVVVVGVLVDVDGQRADAQLTLQRAVLGCVRADLGGRGQFVPGDDVGEHVPGLRELQEVPDLGVQDAGVGSGDARARVEVLDETVGGLPGAEVVVGPDPPGDPVVAPLPLAEHVALGLVERHVHDVRPQLPQGEDVFDLAADHVQVSGEPLLAGGAGPLVGETAVEVGQIDVDVLAAGRHEGRQDLQGVTAGMLDAVLGLGGHRARVHALDHHAAGHSVAVEAVERAARSAVEGAGLGAEVDGEPVGGGDFGCHGNPPSFEIPHDGR
ncbi:hypothetical protein SGRIM119S_07859 [Streptomyces griseorubiginosus]